MHPLALDSVLRVIRETARGEAADKVLRDTLQSARRLLPEDKAEVARASFAYYRWFGWVRDLPPKQAVPEVLRLAHRFDTRPHSFKDEQLLEKWAPDWVREAMPVTADFVRAMQTPAPLWLRPRQPKIEAMLAAFPDLEAGPATLPGSFIYRGAEDLYVHPLFHEGAFEIQDIASQAVSIICNPGDKETWWDACAGEGGKTMHLSDLKQNRGLIWASDTADWRLSRLKRRAARAGVFNYRLAKWDGGESLPTKTKFDGVLVDAPCSGLGTWRRNTHARWTTSTNDVTELGVLQLKLLKHAALAVKPGGKLVYSVCTMTAAECEQVVQGFLSELPTFIPLPFQNPFTGISSSSQTLWPQETNGNGMYVAAWQRQK